MFITFQERMYQGYIYADLEEGVGGVGVRTPPVENSNLSLHSKFTEKKPFPYGKQIIPLGPPPPPREKFLDPRMYFMYNVGFMFFPF